MVLRVLDSSWLLMVSANKTRVRIVSVRNVFLILFKKDWLNKDVLHRIRPPRWSWCQDQCNWLVVSTPLKHIFVSWDHSSHNLLGKSFKIPWFQSPPVPVYTVTNLCPSALELLRGSTTSRQWHRKKEDGKVPRMVCCIFPTFPGVYFLFLYLFCESYNYI